MFRKLLDQGQAGDVGLLLRGIKREDVERQVVVKSGSITPHTNFEWPRSTS